MSIVNPLQKLMELYPNGTGPDNTWDYDGIFWNIHLTWDMVEDYMQKNPGKRIPWVYVGSVIPWNVIRDNYGRIINEEGKEKEIPWDFRDICQRKDVTWDILQNELLPLLKNYAVYHIQIQYFSSGNPNITDEIVLNNPKYNWDYYTLSTNKNISSELILAKYPKHVYRNPNMKWKDAKKLIPMYMGNDNDSRDFWFWLSSHPCVTWKIIKKNLYFRCRDGVKRVPWMWDVISYNPNLEPENVFETMNVIKDTPRKKRLYFNTCMDHDTIEDLIISPDGKYSHYIPWNTYWFYNLKGLTWENIVKHKCYSNGEEFPWNWKTYSRYVPFDWIQKSAIKAEDGTYTFAVPWNWKQVSFNFNITPEILTDNLQGKHGFIIPWDWKMVSLNSRMTWEFIHDTLQGKYDFTIPWNFKCLSDNFFGVMPSLFY